MDTKQSNKLAMDSAVRDACDKETNHAHWLNLKAFKDALADMRGRIALLGALTEEQGTARAGAAESKRLVTNLLLDTTMEVAGALASFAALNHDAALEAKVDFSRSDVASLPDNEIDDKADAVLALAADLLKKPESKLGDFGIDQAKLDSLAGRSAAYSKTVGLPRAATVKLSTTTGAIKRQFEAIDDLLARVLERLIVQFKASAPDFFSDYQAARVIVDRGGGRGSSPASVVPPSKAVPQAAIA